MTRAETQKQSKSLSFQPKIGRTRRSRSRSSAGVERQDCTRLGGVFSRFSHFLHSTSRILVITRKPPKARHGDVSGVCQGARQLRPHSLILRLKKRQRRGGAPRMKFNGGQSGEQRCNSLRLVHCTIYKRTPQCRAFAAQTDIFPLRANENSQNSCGSRKTR